LGERKLFGGQKILGIWQKSALEKGKQELLKLRQAKRERGKDVDDSNRKIRFSL